MELKQQLEQALDVLKERTGMGRGKISKDMGYHVNYISEMLGPQGKVTDSFMRSFRTKYRDYLAIPADDSAQDTTAHLELLPEPYRNCNFLYRMRGDGMHPKIQSGAEVGVRQLSGVEAIISGEIYLLTTVGGLSVVRYVHNCEDDPDCLDLIPYNEKATTTRIKKSDVDKVYKVEFVLSLL